MRLPSLDIQLGQDPDGWWGTKSGQVAGWNTAVEMGRQCGATHFLEGRIRDSADFFQRGKGYMLLTVMFLKDPVFSAEDGLPIRAVEVGIWSVLNGWFVTFGKRARVYETPFDEAYLYGAKLEKISELPL